jgi:glycosyltransferase involved in cell wall biosynthesis
MWRRVRPDSSDINEQQMIAGRDFIVLSDDWDGLPTSTMHLFRRVARHNRVFWFNMVHRMPRLNWKDIGKASRICGRWVGHIFPVKGRAVTCHSSRPESLHVANPFMVPRFDPAFRRFNCKMLLRCYDRLSRKHAIRDPIVFSVFPSAADFVGAVNSSTKLYYCYDDFLEYPGFDPMQWAAMEKTLLGEIDGFIGTSRGLLQKNTRSCPSLYLPHGVDFEHFSSAASGLAVARMEAIRQPIVGFFGLISEWVDLPLVNVLARTFPDVSFVLIGSAEVDMSRLTCCDNVYWLGPVAYTDLPRYARYFDIAIIPFLSNTLTEAVNPLKLLEYFALGLPVLATRLPELSYIGGPMRLASTNAEFCDHLKTMLSERSAACREEAIAMARRNTWENRVEQLYDFVEHIPSARAGAHVA